MSDFVPLDLETGNADDLHRGDPDPGYIRLSGIGDRIHHGPPIVLSDRYVTHNGFYFDFPALDRHAGIPVETTVPFARDLRVAAFQNDPPTSAQTNSGPMFKSYSLDALGERYLGIPKSGLGKELAAEYGGWDRIPVGDPRYTDYLKADLDLTKKLDDAIPYDRYEAREAVVSTITARATLSGMRIDVAGLQKRVQELADRTDAGMRMLADDYGFPTTAKNGKPAKAPQRTTAGKEAFERALVGMGVNVGSWPRGADGTLSLNKDVLATVQDWAKRTGHASLSIVEAVQGLNGVRSTAANVLKYATGDRIHPVFLPFQSTGRWSILEPGVTVMKKGVADSEMYFILADPGFVFVSLDLDQIDIRAVGAHSQDQNLLKILNDPDRSIHKEISRMAFGTDTGQEYKAAKTLDLGWLYGRGMKGMVENTKGVTMEMAQKVDGYMRSEFGGVLRWQYEVRQRASAGEVIDNGFGRRLRADRERAYTQAPAMYGQSTTRELIAQSLIDLARRAPEMLPMVRLIRHDEVVLCVPEDSKTECARMMQSCLERWWAPEGKSDPVRVTAGKPGEYTFSKTLGGLYE